jgi:predicted sugar kinase
MIKEVIELPPGIVMMGNGDEVKIIARANAPDRWEVIVATPRLKSHRKKGERGLFWDAGGPNE